jgi:uncharacterized protein involved in oxidation of intracellular sulfur
MEEYLIIINDPPYGTERAFNALRLANAIRKRESVTIKVFLMADAVSCAKSAQKTPDGYYNLERMLRSLVSKEVPIGACGTCMDARGLAESDLMQGVHKSTLEELTTWTIEADKVLIF